MTDSLLVSKTTEHLAPLQSFKSHGIVLVSWLGDVDKGFSDNRNDCLNFSSVNLQTVFRFEIEIFKNWANWADKADKADRDKDQTFKNFKRKQILNYSTQY